MNMIFRLLRMLLCSRWDAKLNVFDKCLTSFRVWPTDLDVLKHMNNGKYFSIMDLARVNLLIRSGFGKQMTDKGFYPVVTVEIMRFKKSLKLFQKFDIQTQFLGWDDKNFYLEQIFMRDSVVYSHAFVTGKMLHKSGEKISIQESIKRLGMGSVSPPLPDYLKNYMASSEDLNYAP
jgi:acyl-CoA thioesterase FadM